MAEQVPSLRLPEAKDVEIVLVRLKDGTVVARARHEVQAQAESTKQGPGTKAPAGGTAGP